MKNTLDVFVFQSLSRHYVPQDPILPFFHIALVFFLKKTPGIFTQVFSVNVPFFFQSVWLPSDLGKKAARLV